MPGCVRHVNEKVYDKNISDTREIDIITKKCIIEIKSATNYRKKSIQFLNQKKYSENTCKNYLVFAPHMPNMAKRNFENKGITIVKDYASLIKTIKENEKWEILLFLQIKS